MVVTIDDSWLNNYNSLNKYLSELGYAFRATNYDIDICKIYAIKKRTNRFLIKIFGEDILIPITKIVYIYDNWVLIKTSKDNLDEIKSIFETSYFPFDIKIEVVS